MSQIVAADLLKNDHPLNTAFHRWLTAKGLDKPNDATKRQARKFLSDYPQFRQLPKAA